LQKNKILNPEIENFTMSQARQSSNPVADRERLSALVNNAPIGDVPAQTRISRPVSRAAGVVDQVSSRSSRVSQPPRSPSRVSQPPRSPSRVSQPPRSPSRGARSIRELRSAIENDEIALENDRIALENDRIAFEEDSFNLLRDKASLRQARASRFENTAAEYIADKYATAAVAEELAQDAAAFGNQVIAERASAIAAVAIADAKVAENTLRASRASRASEAEILPSRDSEAFRASRRSRFPFRSQFSGESDREIELRLAALTDRETRRQELEEERERIFAEDPVSPRSPRSSIGPVSNSNFERNMFDGPAYSAERGVVRFPSSRSRQTEFIPAAISPEPRQSAVIRSSRNRDIAPEEFGFANDVNQVSHTPSYFQEPIQEPVSACRFAPSRRSNMQ